jgi:hypothetical protein
LKIFCYTIGSPSTINPKKKLRELALLFIYFFVKNILLKNSFWAVSIPHVGYETT